MTWLVSLFLALSGLPTAAPPQPAPSVSVSALPLSGAAPSTGFGSGIESQSRPALGAAPLSGISWVESEPGDLGLPRLAHPSGPGSPEVSHPLSGIASWYDAPTIHDAAAGPPLRVGNWRGRLVTVRYGSRSVVVRLSDWCACRGKAIDLDDRAFKQLAPLSVGLLRVTITTGGPALPATDSE